jgi:SecD/SecF fusion protein
MKAFQWKIAFCLIPVLVAAVVVANAYNKYVHGQGGFKLGVDLVGGTILVYEVDEAKKPQSYDPAEMAASLKRRIDPSDLYNVTIRPVGNSRVELILPKAGASEDATGTDPLDPQYVKSLIAQVGSLEFRILANNDKDDREGIEDAQKVIAAAKKEDLERLAREGLPPPAPTQTFVLPTLGDSRTTYAWLELGKQERIQFGLSNANEKDNSPNSIWNQVAKARQEGKTYLLNRAGGLLIYSRPCTNTKISQQQREAKKYEYFVLTRVPEEGKAITGKYLVNARLDHDERLRLAVAFTFDTEGGNLFYDLTSRNGPRENSSDPFRRHLAIVLDGQVMSAPSLNATIRNNGVITGEFTKKEVDQLVSILRSGALPATLKPQPVSENSMGATLGADTIHKGTLSVGVAFAAVIVFMLFYYRFAGLVASVALLANLLLTVGFMAAVNATFTLPGLAGLVLMLGMAVDANVLIYERLREERDRGASLALAIRNGYDRAFPTIIDTHLSSIFTAIVLYAVGNDQLKGFGISLTVGLIISLFTSLYMTRLLFDIWLLNGWLHKLSMGRLFSKPNIDFMSIRYYWFTATILLTLFGITVFLVRGKQGLNIDFNGGTAYGGELVEAMDIGALRALIEKNIGERLQVADVKKLDAEGDNFLIVYKDGVEQKVRFTKAKAEDKEGEAPKDIVLTPEDVRRRAADLPDWSLEQIFLSSDDNTGGKSSHFTIRTSERQADLVQIAIDRVLARTDGGKWVSLLKKVEMQSKVVIPGKEAALTFSEPTSPGQVKLLLVREFQDAGVTRAFELLSEGESREGRYGEMKLLMTEPIEPKKLEDVLARTREEFHARPLPERLEVFDSQLAAETQLRAMYAILASWGAILLYLWFRFGNWTFGLAAVLFLNHDLFFTLGIIAFCHYIHLWSPGFASVLGLQDFKIDLPAVAALLTLVGYSVNDTIVVFDRIREVRGKNPALTPQMINDSVNQTLSRTLLTSLTVWLVVIVLYVFGGEGVHLFAFCMVVGVIVGTYSSIYIASPLLLIFGEGTPTGPARERVGQAQTAEVSA